jgi:hypothetical protein
VCSSDLTVEFRVFNKTLEPQYIIAAVNICRALCKLSFSSKLDDFKDENSIFDEHSKRKVLDTYYNFVNSTNLDSRTIKLGGMIIERTPEINLGKYYVKSHLLTRSRLRNYFENPYIGMEYIPTSLIKSPEFIDRHTLESNGSGNNSEVCGYLIDDSSTLRYASSTTRIGRS